MLLTAVLVFLTSFFLVLAYGERLNSEAKLKERLAEQQLSLSEYPEHLQDPFSQRILKPLRGWMKSKASFFLPKEKSKSWQEKLWQAGLITAQPADLMAAKLFLATVLGLIPIIVAMLLSLEVLYMLRWIVAGILTGYLLPDLAIRRNIVVRKYRLDKELPDSLDLLTVSVEAGLGFDSALVRVVDKSKGPLAQEMAYLLRELQVGQPRKEAWHNFAHRTGTENIRNFASAVIQADQLGVGLAGVLRSQGDQVRQKRRQRIEELAMKAPIKMLIPLIFFIFPTMFIVLLGPAVIQIVRVLGQQ